MNLARRFKAWLHRVTAPPAATDDWRPLSWRAIINEARTALANNYGPGVTLRRDGGFGCAYTRSGDCAAKTPEACLCDEQQRQAPEPTVKPFYDDQIVAADFGGVVVARDMDGGEWKAGPRRKMTAAESAEIFGHNRKR